MKCRIGVGPWLPLNGAAQDVSSDEGLEVAAAEDARRQRPSAWTLRHVAMLVRVRLTQRRLKHLERYLMLLAGQDVDRTEVDHV